MFFKELNNKKMSKGFCIGARNATKVPALAIHTKCNSYKMPLSTAPIS